MASSIWGNPRQTRDIDMMVALTLEQAQIVQRQLGELYIMSLQEVLSSLEENSPWRSFQILHLEHMFKFDIFVPPSEPFLESLRSRTRQVTLEGIELRIASAEDILVMKLRWYELGNRVSDRQWNDIVQVIEVQGHHLDRDYVRQWANHFELLDLAEEAFTEALPPDL